MSPQPARNAPAEAEVLGALDTAALAALVELAHDAVLVLTPDSRIVFWNRGAEVLYGWSQAEALGRVAHELLATQFPVPLAQIERKLIEDGGWEGELRHRTRLGRKVIVESRWAPRYDADGGLVTIMEINRDITVRTVSQHELAAEAARFRAIFESSLDAILLTAPDGRILAANAAAEALSREGASSSSTGPTPGLPSRSASGRRGAASAATSARFAATDRRSRSSPAPSSSSIRRASCARAWSCTT
jgi:PAS domain S-box-containing protein